MIRFIFGLLLLLGAVGTLDTDPTASLLNYTFLSIIGLFIMSWPVLDGTFDLGDK